MANIPAASSGSGKLAIVDVENAFMCRAAPHRRNTHLARLAREQAGIWRLSARAGAIDRAGSIFTSFSAMSTCPSRCASARIRSVRIVSMKSECGPLKEYMYHPPSAVRRPSCVACTATPLALIDSFRKNASSHSLCAIRPSRISRRRLP